MHGRILLLLMSLLVSLTAYAAPELQDPTRPADTENAKGVNSGLPELSAIMVSHDRRTAVINGEIAKVGDKVAGMTVISIEPNSVQLEGAQGKITLTLIDHSIVTGH